MGFTISLLQKLNRATYAILRDVSPMVDLENNVLQHFLESDLVSLGLWGNVAAKNMKVKGTNFETLGFGFDLPADLVSTFSMYRLFHSFSASATASATRSTSVSATAETFILPVR